MNTWTLTVRDDAVGIEVIDDPVSRDRTIICSPHADLDEVYNRAMLDNLEMARFHLDRSPFVASLSNRVTTHDGVVHEVHGLAVVLRRLLWVVVALAIGFMFLAVMVMVNHW